MFYMASVSLSVCLLATSCKNYWSGLHENFARDFIANRSCNTTV